jgi:hypothetical protein
LVVIPAQASEPDLREAFVVVGDIRDVNETINLELRRYVWTEMKIRQTGLKHVVMICTGLRRHHN